MKQLVLYTKNIFRIRRKSPLASKYFPSQLQCDFLILYTFLLYNPKSIHLILKNIFFPYVKSPMFSVNMRASVISFLLMSTSKLLLQSISLDVLFIRIPNHGQKGCWHCSVCVYACYFSVIPKDFGLNKEIERERENQDQKSTTQCIILQGVRCQREQLVVSAIRGCGHMTSSVVAYTWLLRSWQCHI